MLTTTASPIPPIDDRGHHENSISLTSGDSSGTIPPANSLAGWVPGLLLLYLLVWQALFVLKIMDMALGWLRCFRWFPKQGKRLRALVNWLIALGLLGAYLVLGRALGRLAFTPN